ncbi:hypothetical protein C5C31_14990 [Rathayibacter rathayi]|uniref:MafI family immunity protein n=1 Tax=Rathayibacter rathayi TaxID=33887 RepID=A0ABX5AAK9_RATRA|nr:MULTISPECIES: MafI family immunity protein [Rathayibacter]PPF25286.1 hypothetical protein C5C34_02615 [Rathayibacter rathayi]PPF60605.1 hypothetical protein C5C21_15085 [Rathayibacter tritici]PPG64353.1 hypothetical protein C5C02_14645 [Rathayibacter rathayi]PPG73373.1 hypothetical protein C5C23_14595 [Rathayibacter rathayi]PPG88170.1 hypothetical protein C5C22_15905 [Rathayibacter rathayi]
MDKKLRILREQQLNDLLERTIDRMNPDQAQRVTDYLDHGEYALCLDQLAYELSEVDQPLPSDVIQTIVSLGRTMGLDPRSWQLLREARPSTSS